MKTIIFALLLFCIGLNSQDLISPQHSFFQPNNINTIFYNNGIYNLDKFNFPGGGNPGFLWPVASSIRLPAIFASGLFIGAKVGSQRELRLAACNYNSHFTGGNIPIIGQVPPASVCNDTTWKVYLVNLNDPSLVNGGTRTKTAGGRTYSFNYTSWMNWPIAKGASYIEINNVPGYQPGWNADRPGIGNNSKARPEEICFTVYMDYTDCTNNIHTTELSLPGGTLPLGVEIQQISFAFNCLPLQNMLFIKFRIINKSNLAWDSTYFSHWSDPDIGFSNDDAYGCDSSKNLSFMYNKDNDDEGYYGANPPACGSRLIQCPLVYTGNNNDTVRLPYDTLIGYKTLKMSGSNKFVNGGDICSGDPAEAGPAYNFMLGKDGCGNILINRVTGQPTTFKYSGDACRRIGWYDSTYSPRYIQNSGPFHMNSGDTQIIVLSQMITRDGGNNFQNVCALQSLSDSALKYYYNDFQTCIPIGIQPISTEVPERFILYQNYPNPFNPSTKIRFSIPLLRGVSEGRGVLLVIYDILGRELTTLINEQLTPGIYEVEFDGTNYSSGVYYYKLESGTYTETKKMLLIK